MFPLNVKIKATKGIISGITLSHNKEIEFEGSPTPRLKKDVMEFLQNYPNAPLPPLDLSPLPRFTQEVLKALIKIPCGSTRTYQEIAQIIGSPFAARAVGQACRRNPFPFFIPCHRVVGSQGLGGFLFGLELKEQLLNYEKNLIY